MEYLNEVDEDSLRGRIVNFFENINEAEQYEATSIRDFLDNLDMIKPTRKFVPGESKYNGFGMVWLLDKARYHTLNETEGSISDLSYEGFIVRLDVELANGETLTEEEIEELVDGATLYNVMLLYNPKDKETFLYQWGGYDEEVEDREPEPDISLDDRLELSPA